VTENHDRAILRDLVKRYLDVAARPGQNDLRRRWADHNSLVPGRPLVLVTFGMWNVWCRETFPPESLQCRDEVLRSHEQSLRLALFHATIGDDWIFEPFLISRACVITPPEGVWGVATDCRQPGVEGGAYALQPPLRELRDMERLVPPHHRIDEAATAINLGRLRDAVGDLIEIDLNRGPAYAHFNGDISTQLIRLRGLDQVMLDMYEDPAGLHRLLAFMRDGILRAQDEAEAAGDYSLTCHDNQALPYARELEPPRPNSGPRRRKDLWTFCAAQEYTLVSPRLHDEFLLQYQLPIIAKFGLSAYGCCEDLTRKIGMLRQVPNLRRIAATPVADVARCAEQIGGDYVMSWRPNPTDMVCASFDEARIRRIIRHGLAACRANRCPVDITLKDIETVQGDVTRLARWTRIVNEEIDAFDW